MKTHDVARALEMLARLLKASPNEDLAAFVHAPRGRSWMSPDQIRVSLSHLAALSRIDKQQWIALIDEFNFPIPIRPRDASRDILGKLLRYLEEHEDARRRLGHGMHGHGSDSSQELLNALNTLLRDDG